MQLLSARILSLGSMCWDHTKGNVHHQIRPASREQRQARAKLPYSAWPLQCFWGTFSSWENFKHGFIILWLGAPGCSLAQQAQATKATYELRSREVMILYHSTYTVINNTSPHDGDSTQAFKLWGFDSTGNPFRTSRTSSKLLYTALPHCNAIWLHTPKSKEFAAVRCP